MGSVSIPYVKQVKGRHYFRLQRAGEKDSYLKLPDPSDPKFAAAYQQALKFKDHQGKVAEEIATGSFAAMIREYRKSVRYLKTREISRRNTDYYLDMIEDRWGNNQVRNLAPAAVDKIQAELMVQPGKANAYVSKLSALLNFGQRNGYCTINAAAKMERLEIGEHEPWPDDLIERALEKGKPIERLMIVTGMCSGQRVSDCVRMRHDWVSDALMTLTQQKTGKEVYIPMHPFWMETIHTMPIKPTILYDRMGTQYSTDGVQKRLRDLMKGLGASGFTFHGLRKNATNMLADMSCSPHEISSITGMSLEMVIHYTRALNTKRVAERIGKQWKERSMPGSGNSPKEGR